MLHLLISPPQRFLLHYLVFIFQAQFLSQSFPFFLSLSFLSTKLFIFLCFSPFFLYFSLAVVRFSFTTFCWFSSYPLLSHFLCSILLQSCYFSFLPFSIIFFPLHVVTPYLLSHFSSSSIELLSSFFSIPPQILRYSPLFLLHYFDVLPFFPSFVSFSFRFFFLNISLCCFFPAPLSSPPTPPPPLFSPAFFYFLLFIFILLYPLFSSYSVSPPFITLTMSSPSPSSPVSYIITSILHINHTNMENFFYMSFSFHR